MPDFPLRQNSRWLPILLMVWGLGALVDVLWLYFDHTVPAWDPADHLIGALNYEWMLRQANPFSGEWWQGIWTLSSKYPPLLYLAAAPFLGIWGQGEDQAVLVNLLFSALLLVSVFGLGKHLFNTETGLWAAGLCVLFPRFYTVRTEYFMDYPLAALIALSFWALTVWGDARSRSRQWCWALLFGVSFGLALLMKQSGLFFLVVPLVWVLGDRVRHRKWEQLAQIFAGLLITSFCFVPWLRTNWVFQVSAAINSNVKSAIAEGDPPLHTLDAWVYYLKHAPIDLSFPLLIVPIVGLILAGSGWLPSFRDRPNAPHRLRLAFGWLAVFLVGAYLIWSGILNKDDRYIMPLWAVLAVILGYGMARWRDRWRIVPWATVTLAAILMVLNLFPIGGSIGTALTARLSPNAQHHPYLGEAYPFQDVVDEMVQTQPYQVMNLGVLHSTALVNQHNFTYYGNRRDFRVYARRMGNQDAFLDQDLRSLSWFLTKTQERDSARARQQRAYMLKTLRENPEFQRHRGWDLPDGSRMVLFRRQVAPVEVQPLREVSDVAPSGAVQLKQVSVPSQAPPGAPIPVTYEWTGSWQHLHEGLVLLTWRQVTPPNLKANPNFWLHDHGLGLGTLHPQPIQANQVVVARATVDPNRPFRLMERTAMLPPASMTEGDYTLEATYLNRKTGETYAIATPGVRLTLNAAAPSLPAPELDGITQLRSLAANLPAGRPALDPVFNQLGRLNLYDPVQNYIVQAEQTLQYRLQQDTQNQDYAYGLALSRVLQRQTDRAIAALQQVVALDRQNPNAYAYLAFVHLYALHPGAAQAAIQPAIALQPDAAEFQALGSVASLMQGNLWQAWQRGQKALSLM